MPDAYADLFGMLASTPKLTGALCRGHAPLWDYDEADDDDPAIERFLVNRCRACPALAACSAWVESLPPSQIPLGVTAGLMRRPPPNDTRPAPKTAQCGSGTAETATVGESHDDDDAEVA